MNSMHLAMRERDIRDSLPLNFTNYSNASVSTAYVYHVPYTYLLDSMLGFFIVALRFANRVLKCSQLVLRTFGSVFLFREP